MFKPHYLFTNTPHTFTWMAYYDIVRETTHKESYRIMFLHRHLVGKVFRSYTRKTTELCCLLSSGWSIEASWWLKVHIEKPNLIVKDKQTNSHPHSSTYPSHLQHQQTGRLAVDGHVWYQHLIISSDDLYLLSPSSKKMSF